MEWNTSSSGLCCWC